MYGEETHVQSYTREPVQNQRNAPVVTAVSSNFQPFHYREPALHLSPVSSRSPHHRRVTFCDGVDERMFYEETNQRVHLGSRTEDRIFCDEPAFEPLHAWRTPPIAQEERLDSVWGDSGQRNSSGSPRAYVHLGSPRVDSGQVTLRMQRLQRAAEEYASSFLKALLFSFFVCWRRAMRRSRAVLEVAAKVQDSTRRCTFVKFWGAWARALRKLLKLELAGLLTSRARRAHKLRAWVAATSVARWSRKSTLARYFVMWAGWAAGYGESPLFVVGGEGGMGRGGRRVLVQWRVRVRIENRDKANLLALFRAWAARAYAAAGKAELAQRFDSERSLKRATFYVRYWSEHAARMILENAAAADEHTFRRFFKRWVKTVKVAAEQILITAAIIQDFRCNIARRGVLNLWSDMSAHSRGHRQSRVQVRRRRRRRFLRAWCAAGCVRKSLEVPRLAQFRRVAFSNWRHVTADQSILAQKAVLVSATCRRFVVIRTLAVWGESAARRQRARDLGVKSAQRWAVQCADEILKGWRCYTIARRNSAALLAKARTNVESLRVVATISWLHRSAANRRCYRQLHSAAFEVNVRVERSRAFSWWQNLASKTGSWRKQLERAARQTNVKIVHRCFTSWGFWNAWRGRKRHITKRADTFWRVSKVGRLLRCWLVHAREGHQLRLRYGMAVTLFHTRLVQLVVAAWAIHADERKRRRDQIQQGKLRIIAIRRRQAVSAIANLVTQRKRRVQRIAFATDHRKRTAAADAINTWANRSLGGKRRRAASSVIRQRRVEQSTTEALIRWVEKVQNRRQSREQFKWASMRAETVLLQRCVQSWAWRTARKLRRKGLAPCVAEMWFRNHGSWAFLSWEQAARASAVVHANAAESATAGLKLLWTSRTLRNFALCCVEQRSRRLELAGRLRSARSRIEISTSHVAMQAWIACTRLQRGQIRKAFHLASQFNCRCAHRAFVAWVQSVAHATKTQLAVKSLQDDRAHIAMCDSVLRWRNFLKSCIVAGDAAVKKWRTIQQHFAGFVWNGWRWVVHFQLRMVITEKKVICRGHQRILFLTCRGWFLAAAELRRVRGLIDISARWRLASLISHIFGVFRAYVVVQSRLRTNVAALRKKRAILSWNETAKINFRREASFRAASDKFASRARQTAISNWQVVARRNASVRAAINRCRGKSRLTISSLCLQAWSRYIDWCHVKVAALAVIEQKRSKDRVALRTAVTSAWRRWVVARLRVRANSQQLAATFASANLRAGVCFWERWASTRRKRRMTVNGSLRKRAWVVVVVSVRAWLALVKHRHDALAWYLRRSQHEVLGYWLAVLNLEKRQRAWFSVRAAFRHWRAWFTKIAAFRTILLEALAYAAVRDVRRVEQDIFRFWSGVVEEANAEALKRAILEFWSGFVRAKKQCNLFVHALGLRQQSGTYCEVLQVWSQWVERCRAIGLVSFDRAEELATESLRATFVVWVIWHASCQKSLAVSEVMFQRLCTSCSLVCLVSWLAGIRLMTKVRAMSACAIQRLDRCCQDKTFRPWVVYVAWRRRKPGLQRVALRWRATCLRGGCFRGWIAVAKWQKHAHAATRQLRRRAAIRSLRNYAVRSRIVRQFVLDATDKRSTARAVVVFGQWSAIAIQERRLRLINRKASSRVDDSTSLWVFSAWLQIAQWSRSSRKLVDSTRAKYSAALKAGLFKAWRRTTEKRRLGNGYVQMTSNRRRVVFLRNCFVNLLSELEWRKKKRHIVDASSIRKRSRSMFQVTRGWKTYVDWRRWKRDVQVQLSAYRAARILSVGMRTFAEWTRRCRKAKSDRRKILQYQAFAAQKHSVNWWFRVMSIRDKVQRFVAARRVIEALALLKKTVRLWFNVVKILLTERLQLRHATLHFGLRRWQFSSKMTRQRSESLKAASSKVANNWRAVVRSRNIAWWFSWGRWRKTARLTVHLSNQKRAEAAICRCFKMWRWLVSWKRVGKMVVERRKLSLQRRCLVLWLRRAVKNAREVKWVAQRLRTQAKKCSMSHFASWQSFAAWQRKKLFVQSSASRRQRSTRLRSVMSLWTTAVKRSVLFRECTEQCRCQGRRRAASTAVVFWQSWSRRRSSHRFLLARSCARVNKSRLTRTFSAWNGWATRRFSQRSAIRNRQRQRKVLVRTETTKRWAQWTSNRRVRRHIAGEAVKRGLASRVARCIVEWRRSVQWTAWSRREVRAAFAKRQAATQRRLLVSWLSWLREETSRREGKRLDRLRLVLAAWTAAHSSRRSRRTSLEELMVKARRGNINLSKTKGLKWWCTYKSTRVGVRRAMHRSRNQQHWMLLRTWLHLWSQIACKQRSIKTATLRFSSFCRSLSSQASFRFLQRNASAVRTFKIFHGKSEHRRVVVISKACFAAWMFFLAEWHKLRYTRRLTCARLTLDAWKHCHAASLRQRSWLNMRAAFMQWRIVKRFNNKWRHIFNQALVDAESSDRRRAQGSVFHAWAWCAAWAAANLEASSRLVLELRQSREREHARRRQIQGFNDEEILLADHVFNAWLVFHLELLRILRINGRHHAQQSSTLSLLCLDHWCDAALSNNRAENLRRRRHVRFSLRAKRSPSPKPVRVLSSGPSSVPCPRHAPQVGANAADSRRIGLGMWAHQEGCWQVADALAERLTVEDAQNSGRERDRSAPQQSFSRQGRGEPVVAKRLKSTPMSRRTVSEMSSACSSSVSPRGIKLPYREVSATDETATSVPTRHLLADSPSNCSSSAVDALKFGVPTPSRPADLIQVLEPIQVRKPYSPQVDAYCIGQTQVPAVLLPEFGAPAPAKQAGIMRFFKVK